MSPIDIAFIIFFLTNELVTAINNDGNNKNTQEEHKWGQICGCINGSSILMQQGLPIKCACITNDYDKKYAPGGGGTNTTVINTFQKIKVYDVNEAEKKISSVVTVHYRWKDDRIITKFPNDNSEILITRVSPSDKSFTIWAPDRSLDGRITKEEWAFFFVNSYRKDETIVEGQLSAKMRSLCDLELTKFPFDIHHCEFRITSKFSGGLQELLDQRNKNVDYFELTAVSSFDVSRTLLGNGINDTNKISNDFGFNLEIKRKVSTYVIQYYLPCATIVAVSSISFIIPVTAIPGRVSLVVTLFLTLSNLIIHHEVRAQKCKKNHRIDLQDL